MSGISNGEKDGMGRGLNPNRKGAGDRWANLDDDKREQYEAIERRVKDKVRKGEL